MTRGFARELKRAVDDFWMQPHDLRTLDVLRRCYGVLLILDISLLWSGRRVFYGVGSYLPAGFAKQVVDPDCWSLFSFAPDLPIVIDAAFLLLAASAVALILGVYPRLAAGIGFFLLVAIDHANVLLMDSEDAVFRLFAFFLIFVPPWDQLRSHVPRRQPTDETLVFPAWPLRLFQLQVCLIYLCTGLQKSNGPEWLDGTALYYTFRLDDFSRFALPGPLMESSAWIKCLTWAVLLFELTVPWLIWWRRTRWWCLVGALLFHIGTDYSMNLHLFHWIMIVGLLSFVRYEELLVVGRWLPFRYLSAAWNRARLSSARENPIQGSAPAYSGRRFSRAIDGESGR